MSQLLFSTDRAGGNALRRGDEMFWDPTLNHFIPWEIGCQFWKQKKNSVRKGENSVTVQGEESYQDS